MKQETADHNSNLESIQACYESLGVLIIVDVRTQAFYPAACACVVFICAKLVGAFTLSPWARATKNAFNLIKSTNAN